MRLGSEKAEGRQVTGWGLPHMYRRNDWLCAGAPGCAVQVLLLFMIRVAAGALAAGTLPASPLPAQGRERTAQGLISSAEVVCMSRRQ